MRMKKSALLATVLALACARAQQRLPEPLPPKDGIPIPAAAAGESKPAVRAVPAAAIAPVSLTEEKAAAPAEAAPRQLSSHDAAEALGEEELRQTIEILRANYLSPDALSETALARAGMQGLLDRLGTGARIFSVGKKAEPRVAPFRSETLDGVVGYVCLGTLTPENIAALDEIGRAHV